MTSDNLRMSHVDLDTQARTPAPPRVLVVEDDPLTADIARRLLTELPADVECVTSAEEALTRLTARSWDLLLVDIGLPGASGIDLVNASKAHNPELAHVIVSSRSAASDVIEAMRHGAEDYIVKPLSAASLHGAVTRALTRSRGVAAAPKDRVLAIGAHPDDVEIGIGGTLRRHADNGDDVTILTLTGGEQGGDADRRNQEALRAAEILGCRLLMHDLEDTMIAAGPPTIDVIAEAVDRYAPTIVYTHTPNDVHQDHRNTHAATLIAARRVPRIYAYQAPSTNIDFRPTRFVGIDDYFDAKIAAIHAHASQSSRPYLDDDLMRSTARYWGRFAGGGLVEPLEVARHTESDPSRPPLADLLVPALLEAS